MEGSSLFQCPPFQHSFGSTIAISPNLRIRGTGFPIALHWRWSQWVLISTQKNRLSEPNRGPLSSLSPNQQHTGKARSLLAQRGGWSWGSHCTENLPLGPPAPFKPHSHEGSSFYPLEEQAPLSPAPHIPLPFVTYPLDDALIQVHFCLYPKGDIWNCGILPVS